MRKNTKKSDNYNDIVVTKKNDAEADKGELYYSRDRDHLAYKRGPRDSIKIYTEGDLDALITGEYTVTTVDVSSTQILAMGTVPIELLPEQPAGYYYDINKITFRFYGGSTGYLFPVGELPCIYAPDASKNLSTFHFHMVNGPQVLIIRDLGGPQLGSVTYFSRYPDSLVNLPVLLSTYGGLNPTSGDGTLTVEIEWKLIQF